MAELAIVTETVGKIARDGPCSRKPRWARCWSRRRRRGWAARAPCPRAQSRGLSSGAGRGLAPRPDGHPPVRPRSASTSADSAAGRPSWRPFPSWWTPRQRARCPRADRGGPRRERRAHEDNLDALQGLVFSERLARADPPATATGPAPQALVDDWSAVAVTGHRHLRDVALPRARAGGQLDDVFWLEAIVRALTPVSTRRGRDHGRRLRLYPNHSLIFPEDRHDRVRDAIYMLHVGKRGRPSSCTPSSATRRSRRAGRTRS